MPSYQYFSAAYESDTRRLLLNTDFGLYQGPDVGPANFNLYLVDLSYVPIEDRLSVRIGRSFDTSHLIGAASVDALSVDLYAWKKRITLGAIAGAEHTLEAGMILPYAWTLGAHLYYRQAEENPWFLTAKVQRRIYRDGVNPIENTVEGALSKPLALPGAPELLLDAVVNLDQNNLDRAEAGVDFYPGLWTSGRLRLLSVNLLPNTGIEQPIFTIFSAGRLYEALGQFEWRITRAFTLSVALAWDDFQLNALSRSQGYRTEVQGRVESGAHGLVDTVYYLQSYGGRVVGNALRYNFRLTRQLDWSAAGDLSYYQKVTASTRTALALQSGVSIWFWRDLKLDLMGEFNSNNDLVYDWRLFAKLTFLRWMST